MSHVSEVTVIAQDPTSSGWLRPSGTVHVARRALPHLAEKGHNFLVLTLASELSEVAEFVSIANKRHQLKGLLVHLDMDATWIPQILDRANLRALRNCLVHSEAGIPQRVVEAWRCGAQDDLLAAVTVTDKNLLALTCALERLEVPIDAITPLKKLNKAQRNNFQVAPDGNYVYWPDADVHLDLDALRVAVDPKYRAQADLVRTKHLEDLGGRVRRVREAHALRKSEVAGVSDRQLRRIEAGEFLPRVDTLEKLAAAHGLHVTDYLNELAQ